MSRRENYRAKLHPLYLPQYDALCSLLPDAWQPYYGFRSFEEQAALYAVGRDHPGHVVTNAKPGESGHNWGCASDWTIFKNNQPIWSPADFAEYQLACDKLGLTWGGTFKSLGDKFHNELKLTVSWVQVNEAFKKGGNEAALDLIRRSVWKPSSAQSSGA